ncbi:MAG: DUF882 domain-containing protein [Sandaracinaceae bacterium]|nr:DUF882 domain-containing protein [Sandaracinaceae bacterium]
MTLYRHALERRFRVRLVDTRGRARRTAIRRLRELMRPRGSRALGPAPPARLVEMLARISDHFGGRTITIVSGYRTAGGYTQESSQHTRGHALDLRIQGVPAHALRDYVRATFDRVGVGYYPRTGFVHLDVRDRSAYWVDWSRRGEAPSTSGAARPPRRRERRGDRADRHGRRRPRRARRGRGRGRRGRRHGGSRLGCPGGRVRRVTVPHLCRHERGCALLCGPWCRDMPPCALMRRMSTSTEWGSPSRSMPPPASGGGQGTSTAPRRRSSRR